MITLKIDMTTNQKLLFTDTDSLMHEIKTEDVYEDFSSNEEFFFSINIIVKHSNLRTTVTRHQNSKMSGNK